MTIAIDRRAIRALELAASAEQWTRLPSGAFVIPSQTESGKTWIASPQMCSCPDAGRHPERLCKHSTAAAIVQTLLDVAPQSVALPPQPTGLVATREDDDVISWGRPARTLR